MKEFTINQDYLSITPELESHSRQFGKVIKSLATVKKI